MIERTQPSGMVLDVSVTVGAATAVGGRPTNEDRVYAGALAPVAIGPGVTAPAFLLAVADGMGGHERGEVASAMAIDTVVAAIGNDPGPDPALVLKQAFRRANDAIYADGQVAPDAMGTTLVAAVLRGKYATIASIGDSRAYLVRANALTQITRDHSLVAEQIASGELSPAAAKASPNRNILTQALGQRARLDAKLPEIFELALLPQDRLLLCTDGFFDVIDDREYVATLLEFDPAAAASRLVALAVERGTADNVSAVVAEALPTRVQAEILQQAATGPRRGAAAGQLVIILVVVVVLIAVVILLLAMGALPFPAPAPAP